MQFIIPFTGSEDTGAVVINHFISWAVTFPRKHAGQVIAVINPVTGKLRSRKFRCCRQKVQRAAQLADGSRLDFPRPPENGGYPHAPFITGALGSEERAGGPALFVEYNP